MAWVRDQVYVFAYKGNTSARCVGAREGRRGKGGSSWGESSGAFQDPFRRLCSTLSDMLTDRQADARTNLSSIRPMHFKLIVLRARGIPPLFFGPRLVKGRWNNRAGCWKVCTRSYFRRTLLAASSGGISARSRLNSDKKRSPNLTEGR